MKTITIKTHHYFRIFLTILVFFNTSCYSRSSNQENLQTGADRLVREFLYKIENKNLALVVNHTSLLSNGEHLVDALLKFERIRIKKIFSPEHGFRGDIQAGEYIRDGIDSKTELPIISLYGNQKKPTSEMLRDIDIIIYDIQDIGIRYYTYISTLYYILESASELSKKVILLDRPNPISGSIIEGPVLKEQFKSFVGIAPIPIRYGMTAGELALFFANEKFTGNLDSNQLEIIKIKDWDRSKYLDFYSDSWINPSPNIPDLNTAIIYAGTCLIEATNISEGRGTTKPFKFIGAPFIEPEKLVETLLEFNPEGILIHPVSFTPKEIKGVVSNPKYKNELCYGIEIELFDREKFKPVKFGLQLVSALTKLYPKNISFNFRFFDNLSGDAKIREQILSGKNPDKIYDGLLTELEKFKNKRNKYLLY